MDKMYVIAAMVSAVVGMLNMSIQEKEPERMVRIAELESTTDMTETLSDIKAGQQETNRIASALVTLQEQVQGLESAPSSYQSGVSAGEIRKIVREEVEAALGVRGTEQTLADMLKETMNSVKTESVTSTPAVTSGVEATTTTVSSPVTYQSAGSTGTVYQSAGSTGTVYQSAGSTGTVYQSYATPTTTVRRGLFGRRRVVTRYNAPSSRYYINSYGCTVDSATGRVISCPTR